ncbi:MAG: hypothetical protein OEZ34_09180 [Spirochaetia bacterium]|nr:hypothetical protein [Spirochaetia bacterium]
MNPTDTNQNKGGLIARLLSDPSSRIQTDPDGRRYFKPRTVVFETITADETDIHRGGWKGFEILSYLDWNRFPSHEEIRSYALQSSERFLTFWFEVFDVAVARSLSGQGREIFQKSFIKPNLFFDLGIPENASHSSIPSELHRKILNEYRRSLGFKSTARVFYISEYLTGLTDDVISILKPYSKLWDLRKERKSILKKPDKLMFEIQSAMKEKKAHNRTFLCCIEDLLSETALIRIKEIFSEKKERQIRSDPLRNLLYKMQKESFPRPTTKEIRLIYENSQEIQFSPDVLSLYLWFTLPEKFYRNLRSAFLHRSSSFRLKMRLEKLNFLFSKSNTEMNAETLNLRISLHEKAAEELSQKLKPERIDELGVKLRNTEKLAVLFFEQIILLNEFPEGNLFRIWKKLQPHEAKQIVSKTTREFSIISKLYHFINIYLSLQDTDQSLIQLYKHSCSNTEIQNQHEKIFSDKRYLASEQMKTSPEWIPGSPFYEREYIESARNLIKQRLRPLRMSASHYSLVAGHRHGAMTLNPVMRLWKDRPHPKKEGEPYLTGVEINTKEVLDCLFRLACIADPGLKGRKVVRGKIAGMNRGEETMHSMTVFLLPGSCFPIREIQRQNFPEFRSRVIGESRNPVELGIPTSEDSILTGAWYQKNNHSFFYPVGGDNGSLLKNIWNSARVPGPPAFFFALGQFVHDTLEDHEIYYRRDEKTFRNCIEEFYRFEDNFRKNRGEKTGRRKTDNSRPAVRFMFAVHYSRLLMEALTGASQSQFRHNPTETWLKQKLEIPLINRDSRDFFRELRSEVRKTIQEY